MHTLPSTGWPAAFAAAALLLSPGACKKEAPPLPPPLPAGADIAPPLDAPMPLRTTPTGLSAPLPISAAGGASFVSAGAAIPNVSGALTGAASAAASPTAPTARQGSGASYFGLSSGGVVKLEGGKFSRIAPSAETVRRLARAPDGTLYASSYGDTFRIRPSGAVDKIGSYNAPGSLDHLAVGPDGHLWGVSFGGIAHFDGVAWTQEKKNVLGPSATLLQDVAVDHKNRVWIASSNDLHVREGGAWRLVELASPGPAGKRFWRKLHVSPAGTLYAAHSSGLLRLKNEAWTQVNLGDERRGVDHLAQGPAEQLHAVGSAGLLFVPESGPVRQVPLELRRIYALAADEAGRTWLADESGVTVLDAQGGLARWAQGSVPELTARVETILVTAGGPTLPRVGPVATGGIAGKLLRGGSPVVGIAVELCANPAMVFRATPCTESSFRQAAVTEVDGTFRFDGVPLGTYRFALKAGPKWTTTLLPCCTGMRKGQVFDVGALTLK